MKRFSLILALLLVYFIAPAQTRMLTMQDALVNNRGSLAPETLRGLQFIWQQEDYVYLKSVGGDRYYVKGNSKGEQIFLTLSDLNARLKAAGLDSVSTLPAITFNQSPSWIMEVNGSRIAFDPVKNKYELLIGKSIREKENVEAGSAGFVAYLDNYNLFVSQADGSNAYQVTHDGSRDIVYASSVHREEFGITKGTFWSNNGKLLAFYRMDQSMVTDYPIIDWKPRPAKVDLIKYPMAGDSSHHVTVGVYNTTTHDLIYLDTGLPAEQYLTNIAWSPDDRFIYIAVLNRGQDHMQLNQYDAVTGAFIKTLFEETDEKYVEPLVPMVFVKGRSDRFIWQSNRDGWNHLYLYDTSGKLLKQLTSGNWEVVEFEGFDNKGEHIYYVSTEVSPLSRNTFQLDLKKGRKVDLAPAYGIHNLQVSNSGKSLLDRFSDPMHPQQVRYIDSRSHKSRILLDAPNPLQSFDLGEMSVFPIKNKSGDEIWCRLYKPADFDPIKKYPVIVYWYGGPHVQLINAGFNGGASDYWFQYMAERGYVVLSIDPRGSDNRGKAFEQSIFRHAGEAQMADLESGLDFLYTLPYINRNRMGLFGWSYGGFMTVDFMLQHPGVFKAAVAGGPVTDWSYYEIMYGERYMDRPQENPEGYASTDLTRYIQNLKGKLLLIHGLQDPVVVQQHSVRLVRAAIDKGVQVDYMIYPGHEHNVIGRDRAHLYQKVTDYFMENLEETAVQK